jgi:hypothetical protein
MKIKHLLTITSTLGLLLISAPEIKAQAINEKQPQQFQNNEKNPLYGDGINPMDLIHNANLLNQRSGADFIADTNENLDKAAQDFKQQQLQRMQQQQQLQSNPKPPI